VCVCVEVCVVSGVKRPTLVSKETCVEVDILHSHLLGTPFGGRRRRGMREDRDRVGDYGGGSGYAALLAHADLAP